MTSAEAATTTERRVNFASTGSRYFPILVGLFVGVMLISNVTASRPAVFFASWLHFDLGPLHVQGLPTDGAFFLFPLAYVLGDVISEVYGFRAMRRVIALGFAILLLASGSLWVADHLPMSDPVTDPQTHDLQTAFHTVSGVIPQILLAGLAGYLVGEFLNSYVLVKMKERSGERRLWARLLGSTVVGEAADTIVFCSIAAPALGFTSFSSWLSYTVVGFIWKVLVEVLVMPVTYAVCGWLKRNEPTYGLVAQ
ncbi:queuosine precursor transporter [Gordonia sp. X0973]|uniref:queuosine precursor transporter n=1 Tax=Gordonia sp. X0973 TaxID=2742602 RepID=UPI000F51EDA6|nr:queuosine precursor transporter [Gordonia sp. X0973]QKT06618.1 queuosine precursor transporter [Gordonia sp. X0973]